jgi:hypothetical protein
MRKITITLLFFLSYLFATIVPTFAAGTATLSLNPANSTVPAGKNFTVSIVLNTGGAQTSGADVMISFDSQKLYLTDITAGTTYDQYVGKTIDNSKGTAAISGLASSTSKLFSGTGTFATLNFQAKSGGNAAVTFNFTPNNLNDTNVADYASTTDALSAVTNGMYVISGSGAAGSTTNTTTTSTTATTASQLPVTSGSLLTGILAFFSGVLLVIGGTMAKITGS